MSALSFANDIQMGRLEGEERERFLALAGLLVRPRLEPEHAAAARALLSSSTWRPLPRLCNLYQVEPLIFHHAIQLGFRREHVFDPGSDPSLPEPISFFALARNYYIRRRVLFDVLDAFEGAGIHRAMLIKGAALAPLYPSPALRDMADIDMVVDKGQAALACEVLRRLGWRFDKHNWHHKTDCSLDLLEPLSPLAEGVWRRCVPHPVLAARHPNAYMPETADHLVLVSLHAAKHAGERAWRDLCDLNLLTDNGRQSEAAIESFARVSDNLSAASLGSMFRSLNRHARPVQPLPERPAQAALWSPQAERACQEQVAVYEELLVDRISPVSLELMENTSLPLGALVMRAFRFLAAGLRGRLRKAYKRATPSAPQLDWLFNISAEKTPAETQMRRLKVLLSVFFSRDHRRYKRLIRRRQAVREVGRTFASAEP